jgi:hypothetical protein
LIWCIQPISETSRQKSDENLEVCKELVHNVTLQLADCEMENMGTKEFDKSTSCQNETPALLATALQSKSHCETKLANCLEKKMLTSPSRYLMISLKRKACWLAT